MVAVVALSLYALPQSVTLVCVFFFFFWSWLLWDAACCWAISCLLSSSWPWDHHWPHSLVYGMGTKVSYIYLKCKGKSQPFNLSWPLAILHVYTNTTSGQEDGRTAESANLYSVNCWCVTFYFTSVLIGLCVRIFGALKKNNLKWHRILNFSSLWTFIEMCILQFWL